MKQVIEIAPERLAELEQFELAHGSHPDRSNGLCAMELVAYIAGEKHTDHPKCVSPVLTSFVVRWNDDLDHEGRQRLKPYLPRLIGTAGDGQDEARGWLTADWLVRVHTPVWLELAGITDAASALRALPELRDLSTLNGARPAIDEAHSKAAAAWDAARAAARDAARAAARDAARAAARAAAGAAAWAAARAAAGAAAGDAARDAAGKKLEPTKVALQQSALALLERMIDPAGAAR